MSVGTLDLWHWLALVQHELLLFAGVFFLIGAFDDLLVDGLWLWLKASGRARTERRSRAGLQAFAPERPVAVLIPAWRETAVIGATIRHLLKSWPQERLRLYVGCYRNDPATLAAAVAAARGDERLRLVIHGAEGPTTKADCLNRLYQALVIDEARSGARFGFVVFHDAEDMVDPGALGLIAETIEAGADFVQLPVAPLVPGRAHGWAARQVGAHYCEEFAEAHGEALVLRDALGVGVPGAGVGCGARLEAYAQGGWVGGRGSTPFADGQVTITREAHALARLTDEAARLSLGLGAWGGAQKDAERLDLGPTMRVDVTLGQTAARLSLDWRARVAGEASPGSGLAATLSTSF